MIARLFARFRQPRHMGAFGDPINPWQACWTPDDYEIR